ncbi:MAG TPA: DUF499 domain-containing protein [Pirellulales bacterium]|nr:DUF499 domain-containing protein [Pirellulales bacterium]
MKSLHELCQLRESVFDPQKRDTVLDLADLVEGKIDPAEFFAENYITEGMESLLKNGFQRLEGKSEQGVYKLRQAMGGGKTHNLLALGLLARHPEFRDAVMGKFHTADKALGGVKVVAFSGRESNTPFGIWGALAEQMGKKEHFSDCHSPLQAPGQKAWENLFAGETVLVLLDELPPYFENARAKSIGNSDLAQVTATALSNLLVAVGRPACSKVCLVITDLAGAYARGSNYISTSLSDLEKETRRAAMSLEPVRLNSDELYQILRKRLFEKTAGETDINEVAQGYAKAIRAAKQMSITTESPEEFATRINASYPFHPGIRDLYARFRENQGFQQTRGLIRLMRIMAARMWTSGAAKESYLIAAHDLDLNDQETRSEVGQINNTLENAIAHDIAAEGAAVAEIMDANLGGANLGSKDAGDACKLLLMSSLANVPNAVLGLSIPELVAYLCEPGRDLSRLKSDVLEKLATAAWYLHSDRDGKLFFKNVQNLIAKLEGLVKTYAPEQALKELRSRLEALFKPINGWCYQKTQILPAIDEIELEQDKVTLVVTEPRGGAELRGELKRFYDDATWKNRLAYLTGTKNTYDSLIDAGKRLKAIQHILDELKNDKVPDNDPQMVQAANLSDKTRENFHSAVRETFTTLWYPTESGLTSADLTMKFEGNKYTGEQQVADVLKEKMKFTDEITGDTFRKKCEQRLFTQQSMPWNEVKRRAAANPKWQWHRTDALDQLKGDCLFKDGWRDEGGFVDKGPFPQPKTAVAVAEQTRDDESGEVTLRVTPIHGDTVHWDVGGAATTSSAKLPGNQFKTRELRVSILAVDSTRVHETGEPVTWQNRITLKNRVYQSGPDKMCELRAAPNATIKYTSDGSDPKIAGATYDGAFVVPKGAPMVLAYAERDGVESAVERITLSWEKDEEIKVDPNLPVAWTRRHATSSTKETYDLLARVAKYKAQVVGLAVDIGGESGVEEWLNLTTFDEKRIGPELVQECLEPLRKVQAEGQVKLAAKALHFQSGQDLLDWVKDAKTTLQANEIKAIGP